MTTNRPEPVLTWTCKAPEHPARPGEVHLWLDDGQSPVNYSANDTSRLLSTEERGRQISYVGPELQTKFVRRRVMLRHVLSHYRSDVLPEQWRFLHNRQGRPSVDPRIFGDELHFNLSHSKNRTLVAIAASYEVGVDIEHTVVASDTNHLDIAEHYFTPAECGWINGAASHDRMPRFFDLWTLKESYIKARGLGLSLPLDDFQFVIGNAGAVVLQELNSKTATTESWQFTLDTLDKDYRYAVALQHSESQTLDVRRFDFPQCLSTL